MDTRHGSVKSPRLAALIRFIMREAARGEFQLRVRHIAGLENTAADALSRNAMSQFHLLVPDADKDPTVVPRLPDLKEM
jgi:hypothetical protein